MPTKAKKTETFEKKTERLAEIVERVEDSSTPLETAILLYKDGSALAKELSATLSACEEEVLTLQKTAEGFALEPFAGAK